MGKRERLEDEERDWFETFDADTCFVSEDFLDYFCDYFAFDLFLWDPL